MANLSASGLSNFRRWYTQYKAIHGSEPPSDLMNSYLAGEMESDAARESSSRQISLQEKSLDQQKSYQDQQKSYQDRSLEQRAVEFATQTKLTKDANKSAERAATISGVKDLTTLGMEVGTRTGYLGANATRGPLAKTSGISVGNTGASTAGLDLSKYSLGASEIGSLEATSGAVDAGIGASSAANPYVAGAVTEGIGMADAGSAIDAGNYSLGGTGTAGYNYGGLAAAAGGAAIQYSQPAVTNWVGKTAESNAGKGTARTATTNADVWASVGKYAAAGYGIGGGVGALVGAGVGAELGQYRYISGQEVGSNRWTKDVGIGLMAGGLPASGVAGINKAAFNNNPERIKEAEHRAVVASATAGGSLILGTKNTEKIYKKLKNMF